MRCLTGERTKAKGGATALAAVRDAADYHNRGAGSSSGRRPPHFGQRPGVGSRGNAIDLSWGSEDQPDAAAAAARRQAAADVKQQEREREQEQHPDAEQI